MFDSFSKCLLSKYVIFIHKGAYDLLHDFRTAVGLWNWVKTPVAAFEVTASLCSISIIRSGILVLDKSLSFHIFHVM